MTISLQIHQFQIMFYSTYEDGMFKGHSLCSCTIPLLN